MLRPSYTELMEKLNNDKQVDSEITSRYTIVLAAAKRARQIIDGANPLTYAPSDKAVSIAVKELSEGKLLVKADKEILENSPEKAISAMYYKGMTAVSKDDLREDFKDKYEDMENDSDEDDDDDYREDGYENMDDMGEDSEEDPMMDYGDDDSFENQ